MSEIRLKIVAVKRAHNTNTRKKFNTRRLRNQEVAGKYVDALKIASSQIIKDPISNIQEYWDNIKDIVLKSAEIHVGYEDKTRRWISHGNSYRKEKKLNLDAITARTRLVNAEWQRKYSALDREVKQSA